MNKKKKVGIITWHYYNNYGSALQSYALQEAISKLGFDVELINYINHAVGGTIRRRNFQIVLYFSLGLFFKRYRKDFGRYLFSLKYHKKSFITNDENKLRTLSESYHTIVCGSDQIWAPNCYDPVYFAAFSTPKTRKVSYAASIGLNDIPECLITQYKNHLSDFYMISVREEGGKKLLKEKCDIDSTVVLDPTLLHDSSFYKEIEKEVHDIRDNNYLFCYFLNKSHQYRERVEKYAKEHGLQIIGISDNVKDGEWMRILSNLGADNFIWLIHHANVVMTDSYHGTIFSLLFHKNFWTFERFEENDPICQNSRIRQLQRYFGLEGHIVKPQVEIDKSIEIDYGKFESTLKKLREYSMNFLHKALL